MRSGDKFVFDAEHDASRDKPVEIIAGMNPVNPPCFIGQKVLHFYEVNDRKASAIPVGAPPSDANMARA